MIFDEKLTLVFEFLDLDFQSPFDTRPSPYGMEIEGTDSPLQGEVDE